MDLETYKLSYIKQTVHLATEHIDDKVLRVRYGDLVLFEYTYRPDLDAFQFSRPYLHPIRTLSGDILTNHRPTDHPWHNGLSMTANNVNGMNFWGGETYSRQTGKYTKQPNVGKQVHRAWESEEKSDNCYSWIHTLDWIGPNDERVFSEKRTLSVTDIDPERGLWRLIWESSLTNTLGQKLNINSYSSGEGLEGSGYTGLFLRMSRGFCKVEPAIFDESNRPQWDDYHDGENAIDAEALNGWKSRRLAYQGIFDNSLNGGLLLCEDLSEEPPYDLHWFHRADNPCLAWSTAFHQPLRIDTGASITFRHSLGIASGFRTQKQSNRLWRG